MRTTTEEKGKPAEILSVENHSGYKNAKAKMAEIGARREVAERALSEARGKLAEYQASQEETEARAVLEGKRPDDSNIRILKTIEQAQSEMNVLARAGQIQTKVVGEMYQLACAEIVAKLKPEYAEIERAYYLALTQLAKLAEARLRWVEKVNQAGVQGINGGQAFGDVTPFSSVVGFPTLEPEAAANWHLREGVRRGAIRREEIPAEWVYVY